MQRSKTFVLLLALALTFGALAEASMVRKMDLGEVCARANLIFRGTVLSATEGTVEAGGAELPTVRYRIRVSEAFQGSFRTKGDIQIAEVTMLGNMKPITVNGAVRRSPLPNLPSLKVGGDYLLMTTPPSALGLSAPIGLAQGSFTISGKGEALTATDGLGNAFNYHELADGIRAALQGAAARPGTRGGSR